MRFQWKSGQAEKAWKLLDKYKYVLLVILAGMLLLLWPAGGREQTAQVASAAGGEEQFDLAALEEKLSKTLSQVEGAGQVTVTLTLKSGAEQVLAADRTTSVTERGNSVEERTVVISTGSGQEQAVVRVERYPVFQGALVVSQGGDRADVRLVLTQAVSALTGLGTDRITVCKGG